MTSLTALFATFAFGQTLPDRLPMMGGGEQKFLEYCTSSRVVQFGVGADKLQNGYRIPFIVGAPDRKFGSYQEFLKAIPTEAFKTREKMINLGVNTNDLFIFHGTCMWFYMATNPFIMDAPVSFDIEAEPCKLSELSIHTFERMHIVIARAPLQIPDLKEFSVRIETDNSKFAQPVGSDTVYNYVWRGDTTKPLSTAKSRTEYTHWNIILFNISYSTNAQPVRFTIKTGRECATYNQLGERISSAFSAKPDSVCLTVSPGSYGVLEQSTDLVDWSPILEIDSFDGYNTQTVPFYKDLPQLFFRARAW